MEEGMILKTSEGVKLVLCGYVVLCVKMRDYAFKSRVLD